MIRLLRNLWVTSGDIAVYRQAVQDQGEMIKQAALLLTLVRMQLDRIDTLKHVNLDGYELEALTNLVDDHEELESRIEAVLALSPYQESWLPLDEVHALLRGKKRVPDTVEELDV